ncbi:MAG: hypothetical protein VB957_05935 [Pseudomonadales bacterium]
MERSPASCRHQSLQNYLNHYAENSAEPGYRAWDLVEDHLIDSYARIMGMTKSNLKKYQLTFKRRCSELSRYIRNSIFGEGASELTTRRMQPGPYLWTNLSIPLWRHPLVSRL